MDLRPHVRCVCDPVRCTPLASTPSQSCIEKKASPRRRAPHDTTVHDVAAHADRDRRAHTMRWSACPSARQHRSSACTKERRRETRRERSGSGRKERECGGGGALAGATVCVGLTAITCTDHIAVRKKDQIGTAWAPTHLPRSVFRRPSVTAGPIAGLQIQAPAITRKCNLLVAHLSKLCTPAHTVCTPPRGTRSGARFKKSSVRGPTIGTGKRMKSEDLA